MEDTGNGNYLKKKSIKGGAVYLFIYFEERLQLISPYECQNVLNEDVKLVESVSYKICTNGCFLFYPGNNQDDTCFSKRCKWENPNKGTVDHK